MPADVKRRVGSSRGTSGAWGRRGCPRSLKKSMKVLRSSSLPECFIGAVLRLLSQEIPDRIPIETAPLERRLHAPAVRLALEARVAAAKLGESQRGAPLLAGQRPAREIGILVEEPIQLPDQSVRYAATPELQDEKPLSLRRLEQLRAQKRPHERAVVQKRDAAEPLDRALHRIVIVSALAKPALNLPLRARPALEDPEGRFLRRLLGTRALRAQRHGSDTDPALSLAVVRRDRLRKLGARLRQPQRQTQLRFQLRLSVGMLLQPEPGVLTPLPDALLSEREPGAALLDQVPLDREIQDLSLARDSLVVEDVELRLLEGSGHLVLHDLHLDVASDDALAVLDRADAADIHAHRGVELERAPSRRGLGVSEHHADLHA